VTEWHDRMFACEAIKLQECSQWGLDPTSQSKRCLALLRTNNEQVSEFDAEF